MRKSLIAILLLIAPLSASAQVFSQNQLIITPFNGFVYSSSTSNGAKLGATSTPFFNSINLFGHTYNSFAALLAGLATSPGGASSTIQYNANGAFAGNSRLTYDGTNVGIGTAGPTAPLDIEYTQPTISAPGLRIHNNDMAYGSLSLFGYPGYGGALVLGERTGADIVDYAIFGNSSGLQFAESGVATPRIFIQKTTGYVGINTNIPGYELDVAGRARAQTIEGQQVVATNYFDLSVGANRVYIANSGGVNALGGVMLSNTNAFQFADGDAAGGTYYSAFARDARDYISLRGGDTVGNSEAQGFRVYNTYNAALTNYERGVFDWMTHPNILTIGTENGGTGSARGINFITASTTRVSISSTGAFSLATTTAGCAQFSAAGELYSVGTVCGSGGGGGVTSVTGTYPVVSSGGATPAISLAFGTTTTNTWVHQIFSSLFATNATTTNATTTSFGINSETFTDLTGTGLSNVAGALTNAGLLSLAQTYGTAQTGAITFATSTTAINNDWGITNSSGAFTFNLPTATTAIRGLLSAADWTTFNAKQAALSFVYPLVNAANSVSLAFGTTTSNTWGGTQTFSSPLVDGTLTGVVGANNGLTYAIATSTNFVTSITVPQGSFAGGLTFATTSNTTNGITSKLMITGSGSTLTFGSDQTGTLTVPGGGTGNGTFTSSQLLYGNGIANLSSVGTSTVTFSGPFTGYSNFGATVGGGGSTVTWTGLATTSQPSSSNLLVSNGGAGVYGVGTTTPTIGLGLTGSNLTLLSNAAGASSLTIATSSLYTGTTGQFPYFSGTNTITATSSISMDTAGLITILQGIFSSLLRIPYAAAPTVATNGDIGIDSTSNQFKFFSNSAVRVISPVIEQSFTVASSTAWTGTTTIPLGPASVAQSWDNARCFTDTGTLNVDFYDGTNRSTMFNASTTVGTVTLSSNNTFAANVKRYVEIGTPASSPTYVSCSVSKTITAD